MVKPRAQQPSPTLPSATEKRASDLAAAAPPAADLGRQIGEKLRTMFDDVVTEPVPEKFRALLEELERKSHEEPR